MKIILGMSGASGAQYGLRILQVLTDLGHSVELIISKSAIKVLDLEVGDNYKKILKKATVRYDVSDISAPVASGTHKNEGMIIAPCSMKTVAAIAAGLSQNLIQRAADCMLKEQRNLLILFRETPLNLIHLRNLTTLKEAGATIIPAAPGFYNHPKTISDLVDFIVGKVLNLFKIEHNLFKPWNPDEAKKRISKQ